MPSETSTQDKEVPLLTMKMSFLLVLILVRVNMEDHSQLTEQVEDVKTFLRLLVITAVARAILLGEVFTLYIFLMPTSLKYLSDTDSLTPFSKEC